MKLFSESLRDTVIKGLLTSLGEKLVVILCRPVGLVEYAQAEMGLPDVTRDIKILTKELMLLKCSVEEDS